MENTVGSPLLTRHLEAFLGAWPPPPGTVEVVGSVRREQPGWDRRVEPLFGIVTPDRALLSVAPTRVASVNALVAGRGPADLGGGGLGGALAAAAGSPSARLIDGIFRWSDDPVPMDDAGVWLPAGDPLVPEWLRPFGGEVLVEMDGDRYIAGVGLKRHDPTGWEISVGTEEEARGRGLARRLVSKAARRVLDSGAAVTYLHAPSNHASARVAEAAGFPDLGWRVLALIGAG